jgi:MFS superfamily sulfate permease-like transporter
MEIEANSSNTPPQPSPSPFIINIKRPNFNESKLNEAYSFQKFKSDNVFKSAGHYLKKYYKPSRGCCNRYVQNRLPIIKWMKEYDIKKNLLKDIIGGLTIGVVTIPQGMAYSLMAGLPAVYGLYVSFFTVMAYFLFGTSRHLSLGTYGVVSLMVKSSISKFEGKLYPFEKQGDNHHQPRSINPHYTIIKDNTLLSNFIRMNATTTTTTTHMAVLKGHEDLGGFLSNNPDQAKVMIATGLSFLVGVIQVYFIHRLLNFGYKIFFL